MKKENKYLEAFKHPSGLIMALVVILALISCTAAIALAVMQSQSKVLEICSYVVYAVAALSLGYSVYGVVLYAPTAKKTVITTLKKRKLIDQIMENYGFKTFVFSLCSFSLTVAFAIMNLVSALRYGLVWYYAISAYYAILLLFRGGIIFTDSKCRKKYASDALDALELKKRKWRIYSSGGVVLLLLEVAMCLAVTEMMLSRRPMQSGQIMTIANAAYTFYKMTMAIYNLFKAKRYNDPVVQALRNINFADACMAIVSLTVLMLTTFGGEENMIYIKASVGFAACATIMATAVLMIVGGIKNLKLVKEEN